MKATGIVRRIDDLGRIVIPKEIRRTLRIREADPLEIFTDREGEIILKKYSPIGEMNTFAKQYAESLSQASGRTALIADRDQFIAVSGGYRSLLGKSISKELEEKLKNQQDDYESASRILQMAEREAKIIEDEAQQKAVSYYRKAEADIIARNEAAKNELSAARYQILQYLESLNSTRNKLADTYAELGCLVKRMPSCMEDLIPAISFEGQTGAGAVIGTGEAAERGRVLDLLKREGYQSEHISRQIPKSPTLKSQTDESRYAL